MLMNCARCTISIALPTWRAPSIPRAARPIASTNSKDARHERYRSRQGFGDGVAWLDQGHKVALATVIKTWGSAPRPTGSQLAVRGDGEFAGSVSGGCVEGAVITEALDAINDGKPRNSRSASRTIRPGPWAWLVAGKSKSSSSRWIER